MRALSSMAVRRDGHRREIRAFRFEMGACSNSLLGRFSRRPFNAAMPARFSGERLRFRLRCGPGLLHAVFLRSAKTAMLTAVAALGVSCVRVAAYQRAWSTRFQRGTIAELALMRSMRRGRRCSTSSARGRQRAR